MWDELLAGLGGAAQGGVQGLGLIQDSRQQQLQNQLRQRQQQLAEQEAKRQQVEKAWSTIQEGHTFDDPSQVQQFVDLGYGVIKDPTTGRPMKPKSVQTQVAELGMKNAQGDLDFEQRQREILNATLSPEFGTLPLEERQRQIGFATGKPEAMDPEEKIKYDTRLLAAQAQGQSRVAAAAASAQAAAQRQQQGHEFEMSKLKFIQSGQQDAQSLKLRADALKAAQTANPYASPAELIMSAQELYNGWLGQGHQPASTSGQPVLGGKYQIIGR